jgi:hypothetical protein
MKMNNSPIQTSKIQIVKLMNIYKYNNSLYKNVQGNKWNQKSRISLKFYPKI